MKSNILESIEPYRLLGHPMSGVEGDIVGVYTFPYQTGLNIQFMVSVLHGFNRVSVTVNENRSDKSDKIKLRKSGVFRREPTQQELRFVRRVFYDDDARDVFMRVDADSKQESKSVILIQSQDIPAPDFG